MGVKFINTDLNLRDRSPQVQLIRKLEERGVYPLGDPKEIDGRWHIAMEVGDARPKMEPSVQKILLAIERLDEEGRYLWNRCEVREVDIGFEGNPKIAETSVGLDSSVLRRLADAGVTLKFTVYR